MTMKARPDPVRAERNLRNLVANAERGGQPVVQAYRLDVVDILQALDEARSAAVSALEIGNPASASALRAAGAKFARGAGLLLLACLLPAVANAQTPSVLVGPTVAVTFHSPSNVTCAGGELEQWQLYYGQPCGPTAPVVAVPFVAAVQIRLTPVVLPDQPAPTPTIVRVPRANVYRTPDAAGCAPTSAPCLSVRVPSLSGSQVVEWSFEDAEGNLEPSWHYAGVAQGRPSLAPSLDGRIRP